MTYQDSLLKKAIKKGAPQMPPHIAGRFDGMIAAFRVQPVRRRRVFQAVRIAVLLLLIILFVLPNLNPTIAYAMQDIPIIGELISVFTVYKRAEYGQTHYEDVRIPKIEIPEGSNPVIDYINSDVETLANAAIAEYEATIADLPEAHIGLLIDYEVITNTSQWFTIRLMVYRNAGSGSIQYYFYHIDKQKGTLVQLSDLFQDGFDYQKPISEEIKKQMRQQHSENPNMIYWVDENNGINYVFEEIDENQNFYFDSDGNLVIVFGKYEVSPGYMGCPAFTIPDYVYADGLISGF